MALLSDKIICLLIHALPHVKTAARTAKSREENGQAMDMKTIVNRR